MAKYHDLFYREPYPPMGPPYEHHPDPYSTYCTGITPLPHPPYPYIDPCTQDTYGHHCYHEMKGFPFPQEFPINGKMEGSAFMLLNYNPYLYDNTHVRYGNLLNIAESVVTRISRRTDPSCVDLFGTFDLTKGVKKNTIMSSYLCQCISQKCEELHNYFNIIQSPLLFRLYFSVYDEQNAVVYQNTVSATTPDICFHFTDIRDYYVQSLKSIFVTNLPAMDYSGIYRLHLDKLEVYGTCINTYDHIVDANPYYAFADNNEKIILQHDTIGSAMADQSVLIASTPIEQSIPFQANLTTRVKLNFTAFLSDLIAVPNTAQVYASMFEPTDQKLSTISSEVKSLKETIASINATLLTMQDTINELRNHVAANMTNIAANTDAINELKATVQSDNNELNLRLTSLEARVAKLESIPLATISYSKDYSFVKGQLTWTRWGQLYQVAKPFKASGNLTTDISLGNLVPLSVDGDVETQSLEARIQLNANAIDAVNATLTSQASEITEIKSDIDEIESDVASLSDNVDVVEATATIAKTIADEAKTTVDNLTSTVNILNGSIDTLDTTVDSLNTQVGTIETSVQSHSDAITNLTTLVSAKADSATVVELIDTVNTKASQSDLEALTTRVDALEEPVDP